MSKETELQSLNAQQKELDHSGVAPLANELFSPASADAATPLASPTSTGYSGLSPTTQARVEARVQERRRSKLEAAALMECQYGTRLAECWHRRQLYVRPGCGFSCSLAKPWEMTKHCKKCTRNPATAANTAADVLTGTARALANSSNGPPAPSGAQSHRWEVSLVLLQRAVTAAQMTLLVEGTR